MIDTEFTKKIAVWLESDHTKVEQIAQGADLLLSLNRDHAMYQRIMRRPSRELKFLEYKLRRYLQLREDGLTIREVVKLDNELTPQLKVVVESEDDTTGAEQTLPTATEDNPPAVLRKGLRPDHDKLPADIQAIWPANAERWKKIKEAFETCKGLTEPCDRYEYLKILKDTWYKYKKEMARYDDYVLTDNGKSDVSGEKPTELTPEQDKELKNADSYISKNLPLLAEAIDDAKVDEQDEQLLSKVESILERVQQRVDILLKYGRTLTEERRDLMVGLGIRVELQEQVEDEQGEKSE